MGLKDSLKNEMTSVSVGCKVKLVKAVLNESETKVLDEALADPNLPSAAISRALKSEGYSVSLHSIGRHRRGDCNCGVK